MPRKVRKRKIWSSGWSEKPKKMNMVTELFQVLLTVMSPTDHKDKRQTWVNNDITDAMDKWLHMHEGLDITWG